MFSVSHFSKKYSSESSSSNAKIRYDKIAATQKWAEYTFDVEQMSKLLISVKNLKEKYALMDAIDIAQRKRKWHYNHKNFNLNIANNLIREFKRIHKL